MDKGNQIGWLENNRGSYGTNEKDAKRLLKPVKNDNCSLVYRERPFCCICRKTNNIHDHATMATLIFQSKDDGLSDFQEG